MMLWRHCAAETSWSLILMKKVFSIDVQCNCVSIAFTKELMFHSIPHILLQLSDIDDYKTPLFSIFLLFCFPFILLLSVSYSQRNWTFLEIVFLYKTTGFAVHISLLIMFHPVRFVEAWVVQLLHESQLMLVANRNFNSSRINHHLGSIHLSFTRSSESW